MGILLGAIGTSAYGVSIETATCYYKDQEYKRQNYNLNAAYTFERSEFDSYGLKLDYGQRIITYNDAKADVVKDALEGDPKLVQESKGIGIDTTLNKTFTLGLSYAKLDSRIDNTTSYGISVSYWFLKNTLQLTLSYAKSTTEQTPKTIWGGLGNMNAIGTTPSQIKGNTLGLSFIQLSSPTIILLGSYARTTRNDRPVAHIGTLEGRKLFKGTKSAVHLGVSHYENVGEIGTQTPYQGIVANSIEGQFKQTLPTKRRKFIASIGHRYYYEDELKEDAPRFTSNWTYGDFSYRFGKGPWTREKNKLYLFGGQYRTSVGSSSQGGGGQRSGIQVGLGAKVILF